MFFLLLLGVGWSRSLIELEGVMSWILGTPHTRMLYCCSIENNELDTTVVYIKLAKKVKIN